MTVLAIELNDAGIELAGGKPASSGSTSSPGYAVLEEERFLTGEEAFQRARLLPRMTFTRFWQDLDTTPLPRPFPQHLSSADLAYAHLSAIWQALEGQTERVVLAVPGSYGDRQLGLVLGIAHSCGMPVGGMIDSALAAASLQEEGSRFVHLELGLHRIVATKLTRSSAPDALERNRVEVAAGGLVELCDLWARKIVDKFVRETRFDPLHLATTEQRLFTELPGCLKALAARGTTRLAIETGSKEVAVELTVEELAEAARERYQAIAALAATIGIEGDGTRLLLSHRLATFPGLGPLLTRELGWPLTALPPAASARGALDQQAKIPLAAEGKSELSFVTRLSPSSPWSPGIADGTSDERAILPASLPGWGKGAPPTHLLHRDLAYGLDDGPIWLGTEIPLDGRGIHLIGATAGISRKHCRVYRESDQVMVEDVSRHGSFLNGEKFTGVRPLRRGDRLRLGTPGVELVLISVVKDHH